MIDQLFAYGALGALAASVVCALHPGPLERVLGGTQASMRWHHRFSLVFVLLGMIHGIFAILPYITSLDDIPMLASALIDPNDPVMFFGTSSILVFCVLFPLSYCVAGPFKRWKKIHLAMYLGMGLVTCHVLAAWWIEVFQIPNVYLFILILFVSFVSSQSIYSWICRHKPTWRLGGDLFTVIDKECPSEHMVFLTIKTEPLTTSWRGGDYGDFQFICHGSCHVSNKRHPFTILQKTSPQTLKILIGATGVDTQSLQSVELGTQGRMFGPHSSFSQLDFDLPILWIAGGTGIIPLLGLCHDLANHPKSISTQKKHLFALYLTTKTKPNIFMHELEKLQNNFPWFSFVNLESQTFTLENIPLTLEIIPHWKNRQICVSGPHGMNYFWISMLRKLGIPKKQIFTEDTLCAHL